MFGMPPEPQPDYKAVPEFWTKFNRFLGFIAATTVIIYSIRHVEKHAHNALIGGL